MKSKNVSRIKFGLSRIVALFMAAAMLTLGFASCSSDSGDEAKTYFVKVEKAEHGTVVASAEKAEAGKTITLVATAEDGYVFEAYSVKDADGKSVEVKDGAFKMPASDVIVSVSFKVKETTPDTPTDTTKPADSTTNPAGTTTPEQQPASGSGENQPSAEATANKAAADAVIAKINAIGTVAYTAESKAKIDEARTAYNALTEAQKALVSNYGTLTTAESTYSTQKAAADEVAANQAAADAVTAKISTIGTVEYTNESKAKIDEARTAYNALTDAQKALVPAETLAMLTNAESTYSTQKAVADETAANQAAANAVITKINAIGTVTYTTDSKTKIDEARTAYDALTEAQKQLVTNYSTLTTAESNYNTQKVAADEAAANQAAANAVITKISAIGTVEYKTESKAKIDDARTAYNALTEAQKKLVTNYATLTSAESTYASWTSAGCITVTISPNSTIGITKADAEGSITLTAGSGFTGYSWRIDGLLAGSVTGAAVSEDGKILTLTKASLKNEVYQVSLSAAKGGISYGAQIKVKVE